MARTAATTASSASATTARACAWGASSASTPTRRIEPDVSLRRLRRERELRRRLGRAIDQDERLRGIFGQRYDSAGVALGDEFRVNSIHDVIPGVPLRRLRRERELRRRLGELLPGRRQLSDLRPALRQRGRRPGGEFRVNSFTTEQPDCPLRRLGRERQLRRRLGELCQDGSSYGIFGQRYDSEGVRSGRRVPDQLLHHRPSSNSPSVWLRAPTSSSWSGTSDGQDGSSSGVFGQRFDCRRHDHGREPQHQREVADRLAPEDPVDAQPRRWTRRSGSSSTATTTATTRS